MPRPTTCAADGWSVSYTTGWSVPGGMARLNVRRPSGRDALSTRRGDHDCRVFPSCEAASAFAVERGYSAQHFRADKGTFKSVCRSDLRAIMRRARKQIDQAVLPAEVVGIADEVRHEAMALGADVLMALSWSNGVYTMARRLRPGFLPS